MTRMEGFKEERSGVSTRIAQCSLVIKEGEERLKTLAIRADQMKRNIDELREGLKRESDEINASEQKARSLRSKVEGLVASINETELTATELRLRLENLEGSIKMHYGIDISSVVTGTVEEGDEERLNELRAKIQELGPVNPGILEEFEDLKNRYSFLTGQQEDLNKSIAELEEAITRINSTTRKKLREAFEQLNLKFTEVFVELFGSGKAGLVLTDENNILESGIEIMVQPPGKRVQNINLLSGGEKALTAIALLFAGFLIKPSPLCILDEVDAALDDSNIERFSALLKRLSSRIQFIVITHNRVTMEVGDYLYGITMEEPGVSKVISMQLTEVQNV
jgi:chromosome segregation protein